MHFSFHNNKTTAITNNLTSSSGHV